MAWRQMDARLAKAAGIGPSKLRRIPLDIVAAQMSPFLEIKEVERDAEKARKWRGQCKQMQCPYVAFKQWKNNPSLYELRMDLYSTGEMFTQDGMKRAHDVLNRRVEKHALSSGSVASRFAHAEPFSHAVLYDLTWELFEVFYSDPAWVSTYDGKPSVRSFSWQSLSKPGGNVRDATVQLLADGNSMGVVTDADTPEAFLGQCAELLSRMIGEEHDTAEWGIRLAYWLPQIVETACKLKGYKADVKERRLIVAGDFSPKSVKAVGEIGPGLAAVEPEPVAAGNGAAV